MLSVVLVSPADADTFYPWDQMGRDAAHSWASDGLALASPFVQWVSTTGGGFGEVDAVAKGLVFARRSDAVVALDQITGALVRTYPVATPRGLAVEGNR